MILVMAEKKSPKKIQRQFTGEHRKEDCEIDETTSWPDGLNETSRFLPYLPRPLRRTDSSDDIERYKMYFSLARKNQGNQLTWKSYCDILLNDLCTSDIVSALKKMSIQPSGSSSTSDVSNFPTVARSVSSLKKLFENQTLKNKRPFSDIEADIESLSSADYAKSPSNNVRSEKTHTFSIPIKQEAFNSPQNVTSVKESYANHVPIKRPLMDIDMDVESVSSLDDVRFNTPSKNVLKTLCTPIKQEPANYPQNATSLSSVKESHANHAPIKRPLMDMETDVESVSLLDDVRFNTPSKNVLKKMCTEIRTLAQKTCKTVERMTTTTKYCSTCGDIMRSGTLHRKCSKQRTEKNNYNTPLTTGLFRSSNPVKKRPMIFQSPTITTSNVYLVDGHFKKQQCKPFCRL